MKRTIGLAGKSGGGKNVIADIMCSKHGYTQLAVADGIRDEASVFLHYALEHRIKSLDEVRPESFELVLKAFSQAIWEKPTPPEIRVLLQWWGTEYRRAQDPDYWIKQLAVRLTHLTEHKPVVVSDVRLPDEMQIIRNVGGEVWLVEREGIPHVGIKGHATEHGLENVEFDRVIQNNGTLDELEVQISQILS